MPTDRPADRAADRPADLVARHWGLDGAVVRPLGGGMNSQTWLVEVAGAACVLKQVAPDDLVAFEEGCGHAERFAAAGLVTGRPVAARDGRLVVAGARVALLEHVPGRELDGGSAAEQRLMASTLAAVHRAGRPGVASASGASTPPASRPASPGWPSTPGWCGLSTSCGPRWRRCR